MTHILTAVECNQVLIAQAGKAHDHGHARPECEAVDHIGPASGGNQNQLCFVLLLMTSTDCFVTNRCVPGQVCTKTGWNLPFQPKKK